jgi:ankyrin repeat protein
LRELLAHGANIEAAKKNGSTPLMIASQCGNTDLVRELIARGANIEAGDDIGSTPLIYASWAGHADVVRELLASGANKHHVDNDGETAMSLVGRLASFEHLVIRALLARAQ